MRVPDLIIQIIFIAIPTVGGSNRIDYLPISLDSPSFRFHEGVRIRLFDGKFEG